uniref:Uncharacterized protein n=1 Tax=Myoviridae sp. ct7CH26 TaxID=2827604 RepID=A0A8S5RTH0_9CAUD|nr:MAG TPA: hypothetical protein [Myoviridae sp. ct7CH26]DAP78323.1 MAG TPA: hypothetical protein [Caudoviricetes sp.]
MFVIFHLVIFCTMVKWKTKFKSLSLLCEN